MPTQTPGLVTARVVAQYLKDHPHPKRHPPEPEFLVCDAERGMWLVRWPNGSMHWDTAVELARRGYHPTAPLLTA